MMIYNGEFIIHEPTKSKIIGRVPLIRGLYRASNLKVPIYRPIPPFVNSASTPISLNELHHLMGHINFNDLHLMVKKGSVMGVDVDFTTKPDYCDICIQAKAPHVVIPKKASSPHPAKYGEKVVADLWGKAQVQSIGGAKYYALFQDRYLKEERIYFLKDKSDAFNAYLKYEAWVKIQ
jgi:hypothetical protein